MDTLVRDVRHAVRSLRRTPGFTVAVLLILALGIGMSTAMFTVFKTVLVDRLPIADEERVVIMHPLDQQWQEPRCPGDLSLGDRARQRALPRPDRRVPPRAAAAVHERERRGRSELRGDVGELLRRVRRAAGARSPVPSGRRADRRTDQSGPELRGVESQIRWRLVSRWPVARGPVSATAGVHRRRRAAGVRVPEQRGHMESHAAGIERGAGGHHRAPRA